MGSVLSLTCSKRKATNQDVGSESCKRRKICSTNDDENCRLIPDELSLKHPWSFCANRVAAAVGFFTPFSKFRFQQDNKDTSPPTSLSLPYPPTSLSRTWKHHVFPSFHGADVRKTFLSHILESFRRKGIDTFIDNEIERSKSIGPELVEAIRGSKIAIVLLSRKYASSSWCLDELVEIMRCREVFGQIVMTIFYEVEPTDIKKQSGDFGKAFGKTCKGKTKERTERWRKALEDVATIAGEHSRNWNNEAATIEKIATDVSNILNNSTTSRDFDGLVGMRTHMEEMERLLRPDLDEVRMIGIWGPPGIGKTTIARVLFNQVSSRFQLGAIMVDIKGCYKRLCLDEYNAQLQLQNQMLSQILNHKDINISHLGVAQERLKDKKVLLVLDEVDQLGQLDALAKEIQWFGPGSRIIITTEDLRVLNAHRINHFYKVKFPSSNEAFQIFCMNAFGQKHPDDGFFELAWEITNLAGELPLGLKVLGSALKGLSKQEWEMTLPRLRTRLDGKIENIIKFSYDALDDEDKYLFLYIACLFNYESTRKVEEILAEKFSSVRKGLHILAQKSLISIENRRIRMHNLLLKFGRETSKKEFVHHGHAKRQLLVGARDICEVVNDDAIDCRRFIGINLDLSEFEEELNISEKALERMHDFQFVRIDKHYHAQLGRLPQPEPKLQGLIYHSQKPRSLCWNAFLNICLPSTFNPEFLVELNMPFSKLQKLWEGTKPLRNLKWMDLSNSRDLKELPDLSTATKLEKLILEDCSSLVELPSSIGNAINLQKVYLQGCSSMVELPSSIMNIANLEELDLRECSSLVKLPYSLGNATNLQTLNLSYCTSLLEIPSSIENATNLHKLDLSDCSNLVELPSIGNATKLEEMNLSNCSSLVKLPSSINALNLQKLYLQNCSRVVELSAIENASKLRVLDLSNCSSLQELPPSIGTATNLQTLDIRRCSSLVKLPSSIGDFTYLRCFDLSNCSSLVELPSSIEYATNLHKLDLHDCSNLVELPSIGNATKLEELSLYNCSSLVKLPSSINAPNLRKLFLRNCSRVVELPAIENATKLLQELDLSNCSSLQELPPSIGIATNLRKLDISGCSSLMKLPSSIGDFINLTEFNLSNCSSLVELPSSIGNLQKLRELRMCGCSKIEALPTNINLESLCRLDLTDCSKLKSFPEISTNIESLNLTGTAIKEVPLSIMSWPRLSNFGMSYFESLKVFTHALDIITMLDLVNEDIKEVPPWVKGMSRLRKLRFYNCNSLVSLPQFSDSLSDLVAENCQSLERLDCSFNNPKICLEFVNCLKLNQEARDLIIHTSTPRRTILSGTEVPSCFNHRATGGGSLTIKLKESPFPTSFRFKACIMLVKVKGEEESGNDEKESVEVITEMMDKQNEFNVRYRESHDIHRLLTDHIYTFEVETYRFKMTSTELVFEFKTYSSKWKIKECGLLQILDVPS